MAQQHDIDQAWLGLLDAERMSRYYRTMAARLQHWHMGLTAFVAFGATGAVGSLLVDAPDWVAELLAVAVAAAAVWNYTYGHASKAAMMETAGNSCADLALRWRSLRARLEGLDGEEARREIEDLQRREQAATERVPAIWRVGIVSTNDARRKPMRFWGPNMPLQVEPIERASKPSRPPDPKPPPPPKPPPRPPKPPPRPPKPT